MQRRLGVFSSDQQPLSKRPRITSQVEQVKSDFEEEKYDAAIKLLTEKQFNFTELLQIASPRSWGGIKTNEAKVIAFIAAVMNKFFQKIEFLNLQDFNSEDRIALGGLLKFCTLNYTRYHPNVVPNIAKLMTLFALKYKSSNDSNSITERGAKVFTPEQIAELCNFISAYYLDPNFQKNTTNSNLTTTFKDLLHQIDLRTQSLEIVFKVVGALSAILKIGHTEEIFSSLVRDSIFRIQEMSHLLRNEKPFFLSIYFSSVYRLLDAKVLTLDTQLCKYLREIEKETTPIILHDTKIMEYSNAMSEYLKGLGSLCAAGVKPTMNSDMLKKYVKTYLEKKHSGAADVRLITGIYLLVDHGVIKHLNQKLIIRLFDECIRAENRSVALIIALHHLTRLVEEEVLAYDESGDISHLLELFQQKISKDISGKEAGSIFYSLGLLAEHGKLTAETLHKDLISNTIEAMSLSALHSPITFTSVSLTLYSLFQMLENKLLLTARENLQESKFLLRRLPSVIGSSELRTEKCSHLVKFLQGLGCLIANDLLPANLLINKAMQVFARLEWVVDERNEYKGINIANSIISMSQIFAKYLETNNLTVTKQDEFARILRALLNKLNLHEHTSYSLELFASLCRLERNNLLGNNQAVKYKLGAMLNNNRANLDEKENDVLNNLAGHLQVNVPIEAGGFDLDEGVIEDTNDDPREIRVQERRQVQERNEYSVQASEIKKYYLKPQNAAPSMRTYAGEVLPNDIKYIPDEIEVSNHAPNLYITKVAALPNQYGVYANNRIPADVVLGKCQGKINTNIAEIAKDANAKFAFADIFDGRWVHTYPNQNWTQCVNHSEDPNVGVRMKYANTGDYLEFYSLRPIVKDEQLLCKYPEMIIRNSRDKFLYLNKNDGPNSFLTYDRFSGNEIRVTLQEQRAWGLPTNTLRVTDMFAVIYHRERNAPHRPLPQLPLTSFPDRPALSTLNQRPLAEDKQPLITPLMLAAYFTDVLLINRLFELKVRDDINKINVNTRMRLNGETALFLVVRSAHSSELKLQTIECLLDKGAKLLLENKEGKNIIDICFSKNHFEEALGILNLLTYKEQVQVLKKLVANGSLQRSLLATEDNSLILHYIDQNHRAWFYTQLRENTISMGKVGGDLLEKYLTQYANDAFCETKSCASTIKDIKKIVEHLRLYSDEKIFLEILKYLENQTKNYPNQDHLFKQAQQDLVRRAQHYHSEKKSRHVSRHLADIHGKLTGTLGPSRSTLLQRSPHSPNR